MNTEETLNKAARPIRTTRAGTTYADAARDHLWMSFTRQSTYEPKESGGGGGSVPIIVKGEGAYIWDDQGRKYLDALAGLFVVQVGHGREELAVPDLYDEEPGQSIEVLAAPVIPDAVSYTHLTLPTNREV